MTQKDKNKKLFNLQKELETNRIRLDNAEQNILQYLEKLEKLNQEFLELLNVVVEK